MEEGKGHSKGGEAREENQQPHNYPNYPIIHPGTHHAYGYAVDPRYYASDEQMMHHYYYGMYAHRYQYPLQHMEGVPLPPGIPGLGGSTDPLEAVLGTFPCTRLLNLPYDATIEEILALFQGLVVIDVVLGGDIDGEAFVLFANPMDFQMALQRNRQTISRLPVDVIVDVAPASRADYYEAIANQHLKEHDARPQLRAGSMTDEGLGNDPMPSGDAAAVSLWGQPPGASSLQALAGHSAYGDSMARGAAMALSGRGGPLRGGLHAPFQKRTGGGIQVGEHTGFLRMRGLPFSASKEEILNFFEGYNAVPESIVLTYRNDGRATGEAYIGFSSPDDSRRAMELHRRTMGARYIELFISNKEEQGRALARFGNR